MKNLHIKDDFSTNQVNPHTHIEFWKQDKDFFCKVFLFLFLMITFNGALNAQTAESACNCNEFFDRGVTGETWNISELDPIVNCTRFKGTIVIDVGTQWDNLSISMETGSSIQVETVLTIDECNIGTCDDLWRGIEVLSGLGNMIALSRSIISGANIAIELNDQAIYYISENHFVNNYIGISTGSPFEEVNSEIKVYPKDGPIIGCHFYTETQSPDPYPGHHYPSWPLLASIPFNQGYAAMYISGSTGLYLGGLGLSAGKRNKIYNMRNGVIAKRATTKIFCTDFKHFEGSVPKRSLYNLLDYNQQAISLDGSVCHIEQDSIVNVMMGVFSTRSSQDIIDNYMNIPHQSSESSTRGIDIRQPVKTYIADNLIYNGYIGISIDYSGLSLKIEDNLLIRNVAIDGNVGINLQDIFDISPLNLVKDNEIEITGGRRAVGISMNKVQGLLLRHNIIDFLEAGPSVAGIENAGISGMQVYNSLITENIITGTSNYITNVDNAGIMMTNSMANDLTCNETYDMFFGHWYISTNMETDLKANEFYDATHGLELWSPSALGVVSLGTQEHHANLWLGSYTFGAFIDGPDPVNTALSSLFIADESDEDPGVLIPTDIGPTEVEDDEWFSDEEGEPDGVPCTEYPYPAPLIDSLVKLVRHPFVFTDYEDEMNWMRKADMLTLLHLYPSLLSNTVLDSFFDAEATTPMGELIASQYQMGKIHGLDPDMAAKDTLVFEYIAEVRVLDSLIGLNPYNIVALKALRVLKIDTLAGHLDDWLGMLDSQIADTEEAIEDALEVVDLVTPTNDQEAELQAMLWFRGDHSRGDSLTTLELEDVYAIARQCPWLGARALSEAQNLYSVLADSIFTHRPGECVKLDFFMLEERSDKSAVIHEVQINPNPASDFLYLQLPVWVQTVEIHSLDGIMWSQLQTRSDSGGSYTVNIKDLPPGIYVISTRGGKKVETPKISISR